MVNAFAKAIQDPAFIFAILVGVSIFATLVTFLMPMLSGAGPEIADEVGCP